MASSSSVFLFLCLGVLILVVVPMQIQRARADDIEIFRAESISFPPAPSPSAPLNCTDACAHRCSKSGRPNRCKRACGTCCIRCSCVPPGTAGNHNVCGDCYARQKEPNGDQKCP